MLVLGRVVRAGLVAAIVVALCGWIAERIRFGASDAAAAARVESEVQQRVDASEETLRTIAARASAERELIARAQRDPAAASRLFDALARAIADANARAGVTIYDAAETPIAWAGQVSDPPKSLGQPTALLVSAGTLGPRVSRIEPILDTTRRPARRLATIVAEQILEPVDPLPAIGDRIIVSTSLAPVTLHVGGSAAADAAIAFAVHDRRGATLVTADVSPTDLAAVRARWRSYARAGTLTVLAITLLFCTGPLVNARRRAHSARTGLLVSGAIALVIVGARLMFRVALIPIGAPAAVTAPVDLLLTSLAAAALTWIAVDLLEARRLARPRARLLQPDAAARALVTSAYLASGVAAAMLLWTYERFLESVVTRTTVDILHFSLHPLDATRLGLAFGLLLLHAAVIWGAAAIARLPRLLWRLMTGSLPVIAALAWSAGALLAVALVRASSSPVPSMPLIVALAAAGGGALVLARVRRRAPRVSQAERLGGFFLALLVPAIAMYPSLVAFAIQAKEQLIATSYGPDAIHLRDDLQERVRRAREQIDALPGLAQLVTASSDGETSANDRGFLVWSRTDLGKYRLTSAVELYDSNGRLVSPFALNLPAYGTPTYRPANCEWDLADDISPMGSTESHVLRASRGVCTRGRLVGGIVLRAMLDYRSLPFISAQSPYLQSLRPDEGQLPAEGVSGRDVEFAVYGWSRAPIFTSTVGVWTLSDDVFQRTTESRTPFWQTIDRDGERFRAYVLNDRGGIYILGYPVLTTFGHLINLAELATLALSLFVVLVAGATVFNGMTAFAPANARDLLREVRSSFYRKLFLAFWAAAVLPVVIMAFAIRTYFANELNAGIEDAAAKTVTVAQRLVEDYAALQRQGAGTLDDEIMVLVSRAIDEDVNLFDRARLQATSQRDLFASQLLSTRTPADVYRRVVLDRAPTYVGVQQVGRISYSIAAAPVRTSGREGVVTVPVTLRQQEIEQQIDELDRRILFGAVLFSLLGGALGYWMAERIADPVSRLSRAARRIARGDLDVRIASTSSDELRRLVEDFNQMAADLKAQRSAFERTQRLEAWADMARQVAHDIKNPLTPIQLSAEHARRVNIDRGRPLSPVLDECVGAILGQVRLLRQIATEFSSFASSPTPHPEPTSLEELIEEVVTPYRAGITERIAIEVSTDDDMPRVSVDRTLFARALTNIIENALHAMPGTGRLTIALRRAVNTVVVEVTDTGVGMDEEALAKIFEPYFSTKATGTGLGLTIAKRNVELTGGAIQVASARGVGTTVTLMIPVESGAAL